MDEIEKILTEHYENYDEDSRLIKDQAHQVEFITNKKYIEKYLKEGDSILEVGAGTGRYSIYYAEKGYKVDSVELVEKHLDILKSKIKGGMNINAYQGNVLDLSMYKDESFDITLVLGPMYHLYDNEDIKKAISETLRVTKKGGKVFYAYITDDAVVLSYGLKKGNLKKLYDLSEGTWNLKKLKEEIFSTYKVKEFDDLFIDEDVISLENIASDGLSLKLREEINDLDEEDYKMYIDYHLKVCMRQDIIGYSSHVLKIVEKK